MLKRVLLMVFVFTSSSLMAKYTQLPASCHYLYSKRTDYYNKSDLKCFVKAATVDLNKDSPIDYGAIRLDEAIPSGVEIIAKYTITNRKTFDKNIKNGAIKKGIKNTCGIPSLRPLFLEGLKYVHIFYTKSKKEVRRFVITKKSCGIK